MFESDTLLTQAQVAEIFGVSKRRIQQLEKRAIAKLRQAAMTDPYLKEWVVENVWLPQLRDASATMAACEGAAGAAM